jgi:hypothetical protein
MPCVLAEARPPPYYLLRVKALFDPLIVWSLWLLLRRSSDEAAVHSGRAILQLALASQQCLRQIRCGANPLFSLSLLMCARHHNVACWSS